MLGSVVNWLTFQCYFIPALSFLSSVKGICDPNGASLTGSSGSFTSPNYPNNYPSSTTCRWIITVPEDNRVKLTFHSFDMETCFISSSCTCDHVEIRDGSDGSSIELKEFCGGRTPGLTPVISSGRFMWIEFKSDSGTEKTGFNATYTADGKTPVGKLPYFLFRNPAYLSDRCYCKLLFHRFNGNSFRFCQ